MQYKILVSIIIVILIYFVAGAVTTVWIRFRNPLKELPWNSKIVYLTFDDGIDPVYTPMLLDILKKNNVKASFFILASTLDENQEIVNRMQQAGHVIGLHSYNHKNQIIQSPIGLARDYTRSISAFKNAGIDVKYFRPTWGHVSPMGLFLCRRHHLQMVLWNVIVQDWQANTTADIVCGKLSKKLHGNAVICLHDGRGKNNAPQKTIDALSKLVPLWKEEGYQFETVDRLLEKNTY